MKAEDALGLAEPTLERRSQGMVVTSTSLITTSGTTLCDVLCTMNTAVPKKVRSLPGSPNKSTLSASATLPYSNRKVTNALNALNSPGRGGRTKFEEMKTFEIHERRNNGLKRERDEFMYKLYSDKAEEEWRRNWSAIEIQRVWRGCRAREKGSYFLQKSQERTLKSTISFGHRDAMRVQDELCKYASILRLKAIPGLSLEPRNKAGARMRKMQVLSVKVLVAFLRMIVARTKAKRRVAEVLHIKLDTMAKRIVRFFRYIFAVQFGRKAMAKKRQGAAVKIQKTMRAFMIYHKMRKYRREARLRKRQVTMSTMIVRNFKAHHARKMESIKEARETKALEAVELALDPLCDVWIEQQVAVAAQEQLMDEVAERTTDKELDSLVDAILGDVAMHAGILRMEEHVRELEVERLRMEAERVALEKEQLRLEQERHAEELADRAKAKEEEKVLQDYQRFAKERADLDGRELAPRPEGLSRKEEKHFESFIHTINKRGQKQVYIASLLNALREAEAAPAESSSQGEHKGGGSVSTVEGLAGIEESMTLGRSYYESGNFDSAFNAYVKVMSLVLSVPLAVEGEGAGAELSDLDWEALMAHCERYEMGPDRNLTKMALFAMAAMSVGDCLRDMYQYEAARDKFQLALAMRERIYGKDHLLVAEANLALGRVLMGQAMLSDSEAAFESARGVILAKEAAFHAMDERTAITHTDAETAEAGEVDRKNGSPKGARIGHKVAGGQEDMDGVLSLAICLYSSQGRLAFYCSQYAVCAALSRQALQACDDLSTLRGGNYASFLALEAKSNLAKLYDIVGDSGEATRLYKECLRTTIDCCGEEHPMVALALIRLADASILEAPVENLIMLIDKAIVIQRKYSHSLFFENGKLEIAKSLQAKGRVYMRLARYDQAQELMRKAYEIRLDLLGTSHPLVSQTIRYLAELTVETGHLHEALQNFDIVLGMHSDHIQRTLPDSAKNSGTRIMNFESNCAQYGKARVSELQGKFDDALSAYEIIYNDRKAIANSLRPYRNLDGVDDVPDTSRTTTSRGSAAHGGDLNAHSDAATAAPEVLVLPSVSAEIIILSVGRVLLHLGAIKDAEHVIAEAQHNLMILIGAAQNNAQPNHIHLAEALMCEGQVLSLQGRYNDADEVLDRATEMKEITLGPNHPEVARGLLAMSNNLLGPGYYAEAIEASESSTEIVKAHYQVKSPYLIPHLHNRGSILRDTSRLEEAEAQFQQALFYARLYHGRDSAIYATLLLDLAETQRQGGALRLEEARASLKESILQLKTGLGHHHWVTAQAILVLAMVLMDDDKLHDAMGMLTNHVIPTFQSTFGETHPRCKYAQGVLGLCLRKSSNADRHRGDELTAEEARLLVEVNEEAEGYVDAALECLDVHEQGPYDSKHPWVTALGGFVGQSRPVTTAERRTARSTHSRGEDVPRSHTSENDRPWTSTSLISLDEGGGSSSSSDGDSLEVRPFTAQSYATSRPPTSHVLNDFLYTESEYEAGLALRPSSRAAVRGSLSVTPKNGDEGDGCFDSPEKQSSID